MIVDCCCRILKVLTIDVGMIAKEEMSNSIVLVMSSLARSFCKGMKYMLVPVQILQNPANCQSSSIKSPLG